MRLLLVLSHPSLDSLCAAAFRAAQEGALEGGHEIRALDLDREGFDPVMGEAEWRAYDDGPSDDPVLRAQAEHLRWAEGIILVHPTWWGGPPAMLKGWLDRALQTDVAFEVKGGLRPKLGQVRVVGVVTTMSATPLVWRLLGAPGQRMVLRLVKGACARRAKGMWLPFHDVARATPERREAFLGRVRSRVAGLR